jgi:hypothetical protein
MFFYIYMNMIIPFLIGIYICIYIYVYTYFYINMKYVEHIDNTGYKTLFHIANLILSKYHHRTVFGDDKGFTDGKTGKRREVYVYILICVYIYLFVVYT